jgi:hypothetical protein
MGKDTLAERGDAFNQLSSSSPSREAFQSSEKVAKLEFVALLLARADALSAVALRDAFGESCQAERHHYMAALNELIVASREQLDDVLAKGKLKE